MSYRCIDVDMGLTADCQFSNWNGQLISNRTIGDSLVDMKRISKPKTSKSQLVAWHTKSALCTNLREGGWIMHPLQLISTCAFTMMLHTVLGRCGQSEWLLHMQLADEKNKRLWCLPGLSAAGNRDVNSFSKGKLSTFGDGRAVVALALCSDSKTAAQRDDLRLIQQESVQSCEELRGYPFWGDTKHKNPQ